MYNRVNRKIKQNDTDWIKVSLYETVRETTKVNKITICYIKAKPAL